MGDRLGTPGAVAFLLSFLSTFIINTVQGHPVRSCGWQATFGRIEPRAERFPQIKKVPDRFYYMTQNDDNIRVHASFTLLQMQSNDRPNQAKAWNWNAYLFEKIRRTDITPKF